MDDRKAYRLKREAIDMFVDALAEKYFDYTFGFSQHGYDRLCDKLYDITITEGARAAVRAARQYHIDLQP